MPKPRLHLDADTSRKALYEALLARGHDVTRTPRASVPMDASDHDQLLGSNDQGRRTFTFNIRDFMVLAKVYPHHSGIVLAHQSHWTLAEPITALYRLLSETDASDWPGQVRWLNQWR